MEQQPRPARNGIGLQMILRSAWPIFRKMNFSFSLQSVRIILFSSRQGQFGMRIEAASNVYVEPPEAVLAADEYSAMAELGWKSPTGFPVPNRAIPMARRIFFLDLALPVNFRRVADMAVQTLRKCAVSRILDSFNTDPLRAPESRSASDSSLKREARNPETLITFSVAVQRTSIPRQSCGSNGDHRPGGLRWGSSYRRQALRRHRMAIPNGEERDGAL